MSYSITGKIINLKTKEILAEGFFDRLKNVNTRSYSAELRDVEETFPVFDTKEFLEYVDTNFVGVFESTLLEDHPEIPFIKMEEKDAFFGVAVEQCHVLWKEDYDKYINVIEQYKSSPLNSTTNDGFIYLGKREIKYETAHWYTLKNFEDAEAKFKKEYDNAVAELARLRSMKNSMDYYRLDENGRNDLLSDIGYAEEDAEEKEYALDAVRYMMNILDFYEDNYLDKDERWNREVILCLTA